MMLKILLHESHYLSDNVNLESIEVQIGEEILMKEDLQWGSLCRVHCVGISHVIDLSINL